MRILFYSQSSTLYGSPSSLYNLILGMCEIQFDHELHVVIPNNGPLGEKFREENISFSVIPHYKWTYNRDLYLKKRKKNFVLARIWFWKNKVEKKLKNIINKRKHQNLIDSFKPDLIYVNSSMSPMGCQLAYENKVPMVWHHRETVNDPVTNFYLENPTLFRKLFKETDLHLYPSEFLRKTYFDFGNENLHQVVFNGVVGINIPPKTQKRNSIIRFGMVGRINRQKGQEYVLEEFQRLGEKYDNLEMHLFGDGEESEVNLLKNRFKNDKIFFHGFSGHKEIYENIDFLIVNAKNESFGRVVAEANSVGVPVLAINSGALNEIVEDGINGYKYDSLTELSSIISQLVNRSDLHQFYKMLSKTSLEKFKQEFTVRRYATNISKALSGLELKKN